ncbi:MAG: precorrin-2 dehydrogenase/sirohydrochlorin ferrochelatase family protein, partial [Deferrisomatales bacterium]
GLRCVVVGGGRVATRKVGGLLAVGARVTVVAPEASPEVQGWAREGRVAWERRPFRPEDLEGAALVFAATSDREVNGRVAAESAARGVWVNVADDAEASGFHVPAVLRRGRLAVAVGTGGASPALAAWVRDRIGELLPAGLEPLVELAAAVRREGADPEGRRVRELIDAGVLEDLARGDRAEAQRKAARACGGEEHGGEPAQAPSAEAR